MPSTGSGEREAPATGVLELTLDLLLELLGVHDRPQQPLQGGEVLEGHEPTPPHGPPRWSCCAPGTSTTSRAASAPVGAASGRPCRVGGGFATHLLRAASHASRRSRPTAQPRLGAAPPWRPTSSQGSAPSSHPGLRVTMATGNETAKAPQASRSPA